MPLGGTGLPLPFRYPVGVCPFSRLPTPPLACFFAPIPPTPFPNGEGGDYRLNLPGASPPAPRTLNRLRHLQSLPCGHPAHGRLWFGAEPTEVLSSEQCRQPRRGGDRGRGTSAFEMVLSPGAGRASAVGVQPPADTTVARSAGNQPGKPPQKNHSSASSSRKAVTKPRAAASSDASAKIRRRGSVPENRQITKELSAK